MSAMPNTIAIGGDCDTVAGVAESI